MTMYPLYEQPEGGYGTERTDGRVLLWLSPPDRKWGFDVWLVGDRDSQECEAQLLVRGLRPVKRAPEYRATWYARWWVAPWIRFKLRVGDWYYDGPVRWLDRHGFFEWPEAEMFSWRFFRPIPRKSRIR